MLNKIWLSLSERLWHSRWRRFYSQSHWHLVLDLSLIIVIICLIAGFIGFSSFRPTIIWNDGSDGAIVDLNNPPLEISFTAPETIVDLTAGTIINISFKNNGSTIITDLSLELVSTSEDFKVSRLEAIAGDQVAANGRRITIEPIKAGESREASLRVYFTPQDENARLIAWQSQNQYAVNGQVLRAVSSLPSLKTAATITTSAGAYFTSPQGDQLGIGPVPPIVGIPTKYWVFWDVKGSGDLKNLVFSGYLPQGVELTGDRSLVAGDFNYNEQSRQLVWKMSELAASADSYQLSFEVEIIPEEKQVGKVLPLVSSIRYYLEDSFTGQPKKGELPALDTNLSTDTFNTGRGTVVSQ